MDLICSCVVLTLAACILATHARCGVRGGMFAPGDRGRQTGDPLVDWASPVLACMLSPVVDVLIAAGVSANAVTGVSILVGLFAGGALALALLAIAGSFMVSYGSAKAEAHGVPVPGGVLRRASRASLLAGGTTFVPIVAAIARRLSAPAWMAYSPVLLALALIAVAANASAILRLCAVACAISPGPAVARARKNGPRESTLPGVIARADAAE